MVNYKRKLDFAKSKFDKLSKQATFNVNFLCLGRNPCEKQKSNCEYLCLPTPYGYSCACAGTKRNQLDKRECRICK